MAISNSIFTFVKIIIQKNNSMEENEKKIPRGRNGGRKPNPIKSKGVQFMLYHDTIELYRNFKLQYEMSQEQLPKEMRVGFTGYLNCTLCRAFDLDI